jgi:aminoglycoside phosphotransferase (APT) family kinase protein
MFSSTKTPVSREAAQLIIRSHFGSSNQIDSYTELSEGFYNSAYAIQLQDGLKCVLKVAPPRNVRILRYEHNIMRAEVETLRLVKSQTEMPVPDVYYHDVSGKIIENEYFLMSYIEGIPLHKYRVSLSPNEQHSIDLAIGHYLRQMNTIQGESFGYFALPEQRFPGWRETFVHLLSNVLEDGRDIPVPFPFVVEDIFKSLQSYFLALDDVTSPCLVHWDLWDGNILIDVDSKRINGIIDFERSLWADPLMEMNFGAFNINPDFFEGYSRSVDFTNSERIRRSLYNIYLFLIMVIECYYRNYPTKDQENWARDMLNQEFVKLGIMA